MRAKILDYKYVGAELLTLNYTKIKNNSQERPTQVCSKLLINYPAAFIQGKIL